MIHLDNVTRRFGPQLVFHGLSWMVHPGNRIGLVGPNGAGKTTLLRIMAGLDDPDEGRVHCKSSLRIGFLPQEVEIFHEGTVLRVVMDGAACVTEMGRRMEQLEEEMSGMEPGDPDFQAIAGRYGEIRHMFEAMDGDRLEASAMRILSGLGIAESSAGDPLDTLSGGWRMRVVLARLLLGSPDVLLLDEPTNHLDLQAIDWLERFLDSYSGAFVVVSHDRYFLNRMVDQISELDGGLLTNYPGNYDEYQLARQEREEALEKAARQQKREIARTERFIERFRYKNTKARQVQSKIKALSKVERIKTASSSKRIRFGFSQVERSGDIVVRSENVIKRYGDNTVYDRLDLLLRRGDRVALVGPNGAGKSTLLKLLAGVVEPDGGKLALGHNVSVQYYAQHQLEALQPHNTVLQELEAVADPEIRPGLRSLAGRFLFSGQDVEKKIAILSGGEKARVALAKMLLQPANLLLLDEPTNHLDLASRETLEEALNQFEGTMVIISHDRYFINRVADNIAEVGNGRAELYPGDYDSYLERHREEEPEQEAVPGEKQEKKRVAREVRRAEAEKRNLLFRRRQAVQRTLAPWRKRSIGSKSGSPRSKICRWTGRCTLFPRRPGSWAVKKVSWNLAWLNFTSNGTAWLRTCPSDRTTDGY